MEHARSVIENASCSATEVYKKLENLDASNRTFVLSNKRITRALIRLCECAGRSAPLLLAYVRDIDDQSDIIILRVVYILPLYFVVESYFL